MKWTDLFLTVSKEISTVEHLVLSRLAAASLCEKELWQFKVKTLPCSICEESGALTTIICHSGHNEKQKDPRKRGGKYVKVCIWYKNVWVNVIPEIKSEI